MMKTKARKAVKWSVLCFALSALSLLYSIAGRILAKVRLTDEAGNVIGAGEHPYNAFHTPFFVALSGLLAAVAAIILARGFRTRAEEESKADS